MTESAYFKEYERIKQKIISGDYKYGDKLPSKRNAASYLNVSVITIMHAYEMLIDEGYIEAREKSGYYVTYLKDDFIEDVKERHEYTNMQSGKGTYEKGDFPYSILTKTMRKVMLDYGERILEKCPNAGCIELRDEIRKYIAVTRGMHVDNSQIIIGSGAEYLYGLVAQLFDGQEIIAVENPGYEKIEKVYEALGHKVDRLRLGKDGILSDELDRTQAKVLHVTPFHSYPSNITANITKKNEYLKWAKDQRYIVEDNYDSELTVSRKVEDALYTLASGKQVIYINTFSKTIAPSIRIGYMILPEELLVEFTRKLGFYSCSVPVFEQYVLCELLKSGDYQRHINKMRRILRKELHK